MAAVHAADDGGRHRVDVEKWGKGVRVCVCVCERKEYVFGKRTCSLSDTEGNAEVFAFVSVGADTKANTTAGGGAPKRGHGAPLEPLAQLGDALSGVGAAAELADAAERVLGQAAKGRRSVNGR